MQALLRFFRKMTTNPTHKLYWVLVVIFLLVAYGTWGFWTFERPAQPDQNIDVATSIWWAVVTMTTVGYGDFFPKTFIGRWVVSAPIMILGIGVLGYAIGLLTTAVLERQSKEAKGMLPYKGEGHIILCNSPSEEIVLEVVDEIRADQRWAETDVVLVTDRIEQLSDAMRAKDLHYVGGNPSREAVLQQAAVEKAQSVMILGRDPGNPDSDNFTLGVLVTVRTLNPEVYVVAECASEENEKLLRNAGATEVVGVGSLLAEMMVQGLQDPGVNGVLAELLTNTTGHQIYIETIKSFSGDFAKLLETLAGKGSYAVMGLITDAGRQFAPAPATPVKPGHKVMLIGDARPEGL